MNPFSWGNFIHSIKIFNGDDQVIVDLSVAELDNAFNTTFGDRI